jgi:hypothetical protein
VQEFLQSPEFLITEVLMEFGLDGIWDFLHPDLHNLWS